MKNILNIIICFVCLAQLSCQSTKLTNSWKRTEADAKSFKKLGVVMLSPKVSNKATIETELAELLREKGIKASTTYNIFPLAGKNDVIKQLDLDPDQLKEYITKRVNKFEFDGLLIVSLLDKQQEEQYNRGSSVTLVAPAYSYYYAGYYSYVTNAMYSPGYYSTTTTYLLDTNLYDAISGELIWTGQTETKDPTSVLKESKKFAELIVREMLFKKVIKP